MPTIRGLALVAILACFVVPVVLSAQVVNPPRVSQLQPGTFGGSGTYTFPGNVILSGTITGATNIPIPNGGQINCTLATTTSCTQTATVTSGYTCTASYDAATTVTTADLVPLLVGVSSTTLTLTAQTNASLSGTIYMDYNCL